MRRWLQIAFVAVCLGGLTGTALAAFNDPPGFTAWLNSSGVARGVIKLVNGTAAAPALTFASDTNNGIYRVGADDLGITTNGVLRVDIDSTGLGTFTAGQKFTGAASAIVTGDACDLDNNGLQCGFPTTDVAPDSLLFRGHSASPLGSGGNQTGGSIYISSGEGTTRGACTVTNCGAGDTVTLTYSSGATKVCTRDAALDDSTHFTCGATDAIEATNIAACLSTAPGVTACAGAGCTLFTGVAGTFYIYGDNTDPTLGNAFTIATNDATTVAVVNGTAGSIVFRAGVGAGTAELRVAPGIVQIGGTTSSFPAFKNNGAGFEFRLADDSAYTTATGSTYFVGNSASAALFADRVKLRSIGRIGWMSDNTTVSADDGSIDTFLVRAGAASLGVRDSTGNTPGILTSNAPNSIQSSTYAVAVTTDCNGVFASATNGVLFTLPLVASTNAGCRITIVNTGAAGVALIAFDPNASDAVVGTVGAVSSNGTVNKDWRNTQATAKIGDFCTVVSMGTGNKWYIIGGVGVWASEP